MSRAARFHEIGDDAAVTIDEVDEPTPGSGQVRIRVSHSSLNRADLKVRAGLFLPGMPKSLPSGLGWDAAGVIDEVGEAVTGFAAGDEVFGLVRLGGFAEFATARASSVARKPAGLSWDLAGALPTVGQTALDVVDSQPIGETDTVLVSAAAGGVGLIVAQLARIRGARVLGTASKANAAFLDSIGVQPIVYGPGLAERLLDSGADITVVLDQAGADTVHAALELGIDSERINSIADDARDLGVRTVGQGKADPERLEMLAELIADGSVVLPIEASYRLEEIDAALRRFATGHLRGKVSIVI
jgi:NADPH:quinone reductase-like Zn-dependent oxidoreductase